jgi:hypothetical protein
MRVFVRFGSKTINLEVESCDAIDAVILVYRDDVKLIISDTIATAYRTRGRLN